MTVHIWVGNLEVEDALLGPLCRIIMASTPFLPNQAAAYPKAADLPEGFRDALKEWLEADD